MAKPKLSVLYEAVLWFAAQMIRVMVRNNYKRGWHDIDIKEACNRLEEEALELFNALPGECSKFESLNHSEIDKIVDEAVDVANFAMMIAYQARNAALEVE